MVCRGGCDGPHVYRTARAAADPDLRVGVARHRRHALARWVVNTRLAESIIDPALIHALATAEIARTATLTDACSPPHPTTSPIHLRRMR